MFATKTETQIESPTKNRLKVLEDSSEQVLFEDPPKDF